MEKADWKPGEGDDIYGDPQTNHAVHVTAMWPRYDSKFCRTRVVALNLCTKLTNKIVNGVHVTLFLLWFCSPGACHCKKTISGAS